MKRVVYQVFMQFNGLKISEVVIDQHYKFKHPDMSDDLILKLVSQLNGLSLNCDKTRDDFSYFVEEPVYWENKPYRLVVVLEKNQNYLGVVNAFRVKEKKNGISF